MNNTFKHIRDPLYGFVHLSSQETDTIDTEVYQRLRWIKQLSHAYVSYPTAVHTRFEHSLGATHIAGRMCKKLGIVDNDMCDVRLAILLHDIGHGPFSHLFEEVLRTINPDIQDIHEFVSRSIIDTDCELDKVLGSQKTRVLDILSNDQSMTDPKLSILSDMATGNLDADKLDYLRRDSFHAGVAYGHFDLEQILQTIEKTKGRTPRICVNKKGVEAIENYRLARYLMHAQVYKHHTRLAADRMFLQALDIAIHEEGVIDPDRLKLRSGSYDANKDFLSYYKTLDDDSIYRTVMESPNADKSKNLLRDIKRRKLWKRACEFGIDDIDDAVERRVLVKKDKKGLDAMAAEIADDLNIQEYVAFHIADIHTGLFGEGDLIFLNNDEKPCDIKESSPIKSTGGVKKYLVFTSADKPNRERIADKFADRFSVDPRRIAASQDPACRNRDSKCN